MKREKFRAPLFVYADHPRKLAWCVRCRRNHRIRYVYQGYAIVSVKVRCPHDGYSFSVQVRRSPAKRKGRKS